MSDTDKKRPSDDKGSWLPTPKKVGEFILDVIQLKRTVENQKKQNDELRDEIKRLQRQLDDQAGQLKSISLFIQTAVFEQAERSGERAAMLMIERLRHEPKK
jgi:chaperonin cofactor prefoldin